MHLHSEPALMGPCTVCRGAGSAANESMMAG